MCRNPLETSIVIEAKDLAKRYEELLAVDSISFKVLKGECFGFLGPNGAGKTTTMKMVHCALPLTSGELQVKGMNVEENAREIKKLIGVAPQENNLDPDFTVLKNLLVYSRYFDMRKDVAMERAEKLIEFLQLGEKKNVVIEQLSAGMKRRLILARALINEPEILILDEPTTGLDPQARHLIWDRIRNLKKEGVTILLTTHYMEEAAQLCDRIVIMNNGKIIEEGKPPELVEKHIGKKVIEITYEEEILTLLNSSFHDVKHEEIGDKIHIFTNHPEEVSAKILKKFPLKEVLIRDANLEDVFLNLTGRKLRD